MRREPEIDVRFVLLLVFLITIEFRRERECEGEGEDHEHDYDHEHEGLSLGARRTSRTSARRRYDRLCGDVRKFRHR